jgi:lysine-N-methylase
MQVDQKTFDSYQNEIPELADAVTGAEGQRIMRRDATSGYCVKFSDGLCKIQRQYGEALLSDACYFYPRAMRGLAEQTLVTATLSCPEIARLALFSDNAFTMEEATIDRKPESLANYLPAGINGAQSIRIHQTFVDAALDKTASAEHNIMRIFVAAESLMKTNVAAWPDHVVSYLQNADTDLPAAEARDTDQVYLLQALCGLIAAAKNVRPARLMETIQGMEKAMHVTIPWDTLMIAALPDSVHTIRSLYTRWETEWAPQFTQLLRQYLAAQLSLAFFPFGGFGNTLTQRIAIIGVRMATVKLALMCACSNSAAPLNEKESVRVVQSLSRFLDHLAEPEFSIRIYQETGWLQKRRLRALLGDK